MQFLLYSAEVLWVGQEPVSGLLINCEIFHPSPSDLFQNPLNMTFSEIRRTQSNIQSDESRKQLAHIFTPQFQDLHRFATPKEACRWQSCGESINRGRPIA